MAEASKVVNEEGSHKNEIQQTRDLFFAKFSHLLPPEVIFDLPFTNNARHMTGVEPDRIQYAIMSNVTYAELCEVRFFFKGDDEAFNAMCTTGDLNTMREVVSTVPARMDLMMAIINIVKSSTGFQILQQIFRRRECEGYTLDASNRDIVNFGSMMRLLDPATVTPSKDLGKTVRRRLREFAFPLPHDDLSDRYDGDLEDVRIDYEAVRSEISQNMDLRKSVFDEMVKSALQEVKEIAKII